MRKILKKLCEILLKLFFDGVVKDFYLINKCLFVYNYKKDVWRGIGMRFEFNIFIIKI